MKKQSIIKLQPLDSTKSISLVSPGSETGHSGLTRIKESSKDLNTTAENCSTYSCKTRMNYSPVSVASMVSTNVDKNEDGGPAITSAQYKKSVSPSLPSASASSIPKVEEAKQVSPTTAKRLLIKLHSFSRQGSLSYDKENDSNRTTPTASVVDSRKILNDDDDVWWSDKPTAVEDMTEEEAELDRKAEEFARQQTRASMSRFTRRYKFIGNPTKSFAEEQTQEIKTSSVKVYNKDDFAFPEDEEQAEILKLHISNIVGALEEDERREVFARNKTKGWSRKGPGRQRRNAKDLFSKSEMDSLVDMNLGIQIAAQTGGQEPLPVQRPNKKYANRKQSTAMRQYLA